MTRSPTLIAHPTAFWRRRIRAACVPRPLAVSRRDREPIVAGPGARPQAPGADYRDPGQNRPWTDSGEAQLVVHRACQSVAVLFRFYAKFLKDGDDEANAKIPAHLAQRH